MSGNDNAESSNLGGGESLTKVVNDNSPSKIGDTKATTLNETENKEMAKRGRKPEKEKVKRNPTPPLMSRYVCKEINGVRTLGKVTSYCYKSKLYTVKFNNGTDEDMEPDEVLKIEPIMEDFLP